MEPDHLPRWKPGVSASPDDRRGSQAEGGWYFRLCWSVIDHVGARPERSILFWFLLLAGSLFMFGLFLIPNWSTAQLSRDERLGLALFMGGYLFIFGVAAVIFDMRDRRHH